MLFTNLNSNSGHSSDKLPFASALKFFLKLSTMFSLHNRVSCSMIYDQYVFLFGFFCLQMLRHTQYSEYHHISFTIFHIWAKPCFICVRFCVFIIVLIQFAFQLSAQRLPPPTNGGIGKLTLVWDQCEMSDKNSEKKKEANLKRQAWAHHQAEVMMGPLLAPGPLSL